MDDVQGTLVVATNLLSRFNKKDTYLWGTREEMCTLLLPPPLLLLLLPQQCDLFSLFFLCFFPLFSACIYWSCLPQGKDIIVFRFILEHIVVASGILALKVIIVLSLDEDF